LNCFILGCKTVFSVKIDETEVVDNLKQEISKGNPRTFATVDVSRFTLYKIKVDVSNFDMYDKILTQISQTTTTFTPKVRLTSSISQYFLLL
jgi:hypothetical protein